MTYRERLSATVEKTLLAAGHRAVAEGRAPSLSAWVNGALARQAEHDRRIEALDEFFREYEAAHGALTPRDIERATRSTRDRAIRIRPRRRTGTARRRRGPA